MKNIPKWLDWSNIDQYDKKSYVFEYVYGIKDIQINLKSFTDKAAYVTKPIILEGNITEVSLQSEESNITVINSHSNTNQYDTSIEYYFSFKDAPSNSDWTPVLPEGQTAVFNELLFKNLPLRFQADTAEDISVYRNGVKTTNWLNNTNVIEILGTYDPHAVYTISYSVDLNKQDPNNIVVPVNDRISTRFVAKDGSIGEIFTHGTTHNGTIYLSKYPYVDYAQINTPGSTYEPIEVELSEHALGSIEATIINASTDPPTTNITDYLTQAKQVIEIYDADTNNQFEYIHDQNTIQFAQTFNNTNIIENSTINDGDADIRIKYQYLSTTVRFKVILRRTNKTMDSATPYVEAYSLIFREVK